MVANSMIVDVERFLTDMALSRRMPKTVADYRHLLTMFFDFIGRQSAREVTEDDIQKFLLQHITRLHENTYFMYVARLKTFFLRYNPVIFVWMKNNVKPRRCETETTPLTREQLFGLAEEFKRSVVKPTGNSKTTSYYGLSLGTIFLPKSESHCSRCNVKIMKNEKAIVIHSVRGKKSLSCMTCAKPNERDKEDKMADLWEAVHWFIASIGSRIGETCALNIGDIVRVDSDFKIVFRAETTKTKKRREVFLPRGSYAGSMFYNYIHKYRQNAECSAPLFVNRDGRRLQKFSVEAKYRRARKKLGITVRCTPHVLRHTYDTFLLIKKRVPAKTVSAITGQSVQTLNKVYAHVTEEDKQDVARKYQIV